MMATMCSARSSSLLDPPPETRGCLVIVACAALMLAAFAPSAGQTQELPEPMVGVWGREACVPTNNPGDQTGRTFLLLNNFGFMSITDVSNVGLGVRLTMASLSEITLKKNGDVMEAKLLTQKTSSNQQPGEVVRFKLVGGRLNVGGSGSGPDFDFVRCQDLPSAVRWPFAEGIAAFEALGAITRACTRGDGPDCLKTAFRFADVNGDDQLTAAEIARVLRALGFLVGYAASPGGSVTVEELAKPVAIAGFAGPFLAKTMLEGMDYDGNGALSLQELLQDRGDLADLTAAAAAVQPAAIQAALAAALAALPTLVKLLPF